MKQPPPVITQTSYPFGRRKIGKVRDMYFAVALHRALAVATDRISAYDSILPDGVPDKGPVLNLMSAFWLRKYAGIIPNHLLSVDPAEYPAACQPYAAELTGRSMLVIEARPLTVECVVRGYLAGSGWTDYQKTGAVCGIKLPKGLRESEELSEPIFTPATKAETGHDENISFDRMVKLVGPEAAETARTASLALYTQARDYAGKRGVIIADTKFEFGYDEDGQLMLIDEVLTPDSSRFWPVDGYEPGRAQPSFDKQPVRDYLKDILKWNKEPPAPSLPPEIIQQTTARYQEAFTLLCE